MSSLAKKKNTKENQSIIHLRFETGNVLPNWWNNFPVLWWTKHRFEANALELSHISLWNLTIPVKRVERFCFCSLIATRGRVCAVVLQASTDFFYAIIACCTFHSHLSCFWIFFCIIWAFCFFARVQEACLVPEVLLALQDSLYEFSSIFHYSIILPDWRWHTWWYILSVSIGYWWYRWSCWSKRKHGMSAYCSGISTYEKV